MSNADGPHGFADLETSLRAALAQEGERIVPADRQRDIRERTAARLGRSGGWPPGWLLPVAAALLVVFVAAGAYLVLRPGPGATSVVVAGSPSATISTSVAPSASGSTSPGTPVPPPPSASASPIVGPVAQLPVYYVGAGTSVTPYLLHRDFLDGQPVADPGPAGLAAAAVTMSMTGRDRTGRALPAYPGLLTGWPADATATATLGGGEIRIVLSAAGRAGLPAGQQRILVQSLVWTATAAAKANLPVRLSVGESGAPFETMPAGVYKRPADTTADLAPIWVLDPLRSTAVAAGRPVTVTGQACTFEGAYAWELRSNGGIIQSGHGTATSGCPVRGDFSIPLGMLAPGDYTIRVYEVSMKDGGVFAEELMPFAVR